ncbi:MAG: response regulator transcription factor [Saccharofermentans sp.]|nr:response regulator transcription factor [Saccharofermentans sp.]
MVNKRLVLISFDPAVIREKVPVLSEAGFDVKVTSDIASVSEVLASFKPDAVIGEASTKGTDDFAILSLVRTISDIPFICYTASESIDDMEIAYKLGCDDYITLNTNNRIVLLRLFACIKKSGKSKGFVVEFPPLTMDIRTRDVYLNGQYVKLTNREFEILNFLAERPNQTVSIQDVYKEVWGTDTPCDNHLVMVNISYLRKKFEKALPNKEFIKTQWGVGYAFAYPPIDNSIN